METLINSDGTPTASSTAADDLIKDTDASTFMQDVVEASKTVPVIVDFWAPWCGPCKQLGPTIEKLVKHAGGLVKLVKINVDENQQIAAQMQVQSIPAVFGFKNGQPVDGFVGAQAESQIQAFIDRLTGGAKAPVDEMIDAAMEALSNGEVDQAHTLFAEVLNAEPTNAAALGGLIRVAMAQDDLAGAREIADNLDSKIKTNAEVISAIAALDLAEQSQNVEGNDVIALRETLAANENDHQTRFDLAMALFAAQNVEEAMDQLIEIVKRDRAWNDDGAREQLLKFFDALGAMDEHTQEGRRKLSTVLFS